MLPFLISFRNIISFPDDTNLTLTSIDHRIFGSKEKLLSQEELKARKDEESLFSELPELPTLLSNVAEVIDNNHSDEIMEGSSKKSRTDK